MPRKRDNQSKKLEDLIDRKLGIVNGKNVGSQVVVRCPKCKIYTLMKVFYTMHLAPDILMVDMEQLKPKKI
jgi:hypothetical protein